MVLAGALILAGVGMSQQREAKSGARS